MMELKTQIVNSLSCTVHVVNSLMQTLLDCLNLSDLFLAHSLNFVPLKYNIGLQI